MSSVALFILALPLMVLSFSFGFEALRYVYVKDRMQDVLDGAAQTAIAQTISRNDDATGEPVIFLNTTNNSTVNYTYGATEDAAKRFYKNNTESLRTAKIFCSKLQSGLGCGNTPVSANFFVSEMGTVVDPARLNNSFLFAGELCENFKDSKRYGVKFTVEEEISTAFLKIFGVESFPLKLSSQAYLRGRGC